MFAHGFYVLFLLCTLWETTASTVKLGFPLWSWSPTMKLRLLPWSWGSHCEVGLPPWSCGSSHEVGVPTVKLGLPRAPMKLGFPHVDWAYELCISKVRLWDVLVWEAVFLKQTISAGCLERLLVFISCQRSERPTAFPRGTLAFPFQIQPAGLSFQ